MVRYEFKSIDYWGTWDDLDNITFCNKTKSPLIEDFINGKYFDNKNIELRQVVIEHILTISPDFDVLYYDEKSCADSFYDDGKIIVDVGSNDRKEVLIKETSILDTIQFCPCFAVSGLARACFCSKPA